MSRTTELTTIHRSGECLLEIKQTIKNGTVKSSSKIEHSLTPDEAVEVAANILDWVVNQRFKKNRRGATNA